MQLVENFLPSRRCTPMERPFRETFGSLGFQRSNRVKTMEPCRLFLNVSFYRKKVSADERAVF
jgi:hypothetical protein